MSTVTLDAELRANLCQNIKHTVPVSTLVINCWAIGHFRSFGLCKVWLLGHWSFPMYWAVKIQEVIFLSHVQVLAGFVVLLSNKSY